MLGQRDRHHVERVVGVHQQRGSRGAGSSRRPGRVRGAIRPLSKNTSGDQGRRGAVVHRRRQPLGDALERRLRYPHHLEALLGEPIELAADRVELAVGGDQPRPRAERERGEQAHHQLVGVRRQRDAAARVAEQPGEPLPDRLGPGEGALPLLVHQLGGVEPRLGLGLEADVGPGLVRMAGEEQPVRHAKARGSAPRAHWASR